jgi:hypothetical protein
MSDDVKYLTLGQAAKITGRSKATIFKAIESGRLSYLEKTTRGYKLDSKEVFLVFPPNDSDIVQGERSQTFNERTIENNFLKRENELLREQVNDLRQRLDKESEERRMTAKMLLTHQPQQARPEPRQQETSLLWRKLFGRH